jgi:hypothetical protein
MYSSISLFKNQNMTELYINIWLVPRSKHIYSRL